MGGIPSLTKQIVGMEHLEDQNLHTRPDRYARNATTFLVKNPFGGVDGRPEMSSAQGAPLSAKQNKPLVGNP